MINCNDPGQLEFATRSGNDFAYGQEVIYTCNTGYKGATGLPEDIIITCGADKMWTPRDTCVCKWKH